jgi:hypothetical protein
MAGPLKTLADRRAAADRLPARPADRTDAGVRGFLAEGGSGQCRVPGLG